MSWRTCVVVKQIQSNPISFKNTSVHWRLSSRRPSRHEVGREQKHSPDPVPSHCSSQARLWMYYEWHSIQYQSMTTGQHPPRWTKTGTSLVSSMYMEANEAPLNCSRCRYEATSKLICMQQEVQIKWDVSIHGRDLYLLKLTLGPPKKFQHQTRAEEAE